MLWRNYQKGLENPIFLLIVVVCLSVTIIHLHKSTLQSFDDAVHIAAIFVGYNSTFNVYTSLKSIFYFRNKSLHFHFLTDSISRNNLQVMFTTWDIPKVNVEYYNINQLTSLKYAKLFFPQIIRSKMTRKVILLDAGVIFECNILKIWSLFKEFNNQQVMGLFEVPSRKKEKRFSESIILYNFQHVEETFWNVLRNIVSNPQMNDASFLEILNTITKTQPVLIHQFSKRQEAINCNIHTTSEKDYLNSSIAMSLCDGYLLRKFMANCSILPKNDILKEDTFISNCSDFLQAIEFSWRVLSYVKTFKKEVTGNVTLVSQLTYDRMIMLEELSQRWKGPMSITLYLKESELFKAMNFIENTGSLSRLNIAYHVVFKEKILHPINLCRNVAWKNVVTPYVFLNDIDFLPMKDLDKVLEDYIIELKNVTLKALVIPAFQTTKKFNYNYPNTKEEALILFNRHLINRFSFQGLSAGHRATNYTFWQTAQKPYKITWEKNYEPYIVVTSESPKYDERFVGYGWNKIHHITNLHVKGYEFYVLPNAFVIHRSHQPTNDARAFMTTRYRWCANQVMDSLLTELEQSCNCTLNHL